MHLFVKWNLVRQLRKGTFTKYGLHCATSCQSLSYLYLMHCCPLCEHQDHHYSLR